MTEQLQALAVKCPSYASFQQLGGAEQQQGNQEAALIAFAQAYGLAATDDEGALSLAHYGQVLLEHGQRAEALAVFQAARALHRNTPEWITELALRLDIELAEQPLQADFLIRSLSTLEFGLPSLVSVKIPERRPMRSSVSIRFDYQPGGIEADSAATITQIVDALLSSQFVGKQFRLLDHAGSSGDGVGLSSKRAEAIYKRILDAEPSLRSRLSSGGMGASKPLYTGNIEIMQRLNRRLEILIE